MYSKNHQATNIKPLNITNIFKYHNLKLFKHYTAMTGKIFLFLQVVSNKAGGAPLLPFPPSLCVSSLPSCGRLKGAELLLMTQMQQWLEEDFPSMNQRDPCKGNVVFSYIKKEAQSNKALPHHPHTICCCTMFLLLLFCCLSREYDTLWATVLLCGNYVKDRLSPGYLWSL